MYRTITSIGIPRIVSTKNSAPTASGCSPCRAPPQVRMSNRTPSTEKASAAPRTLSGRNRVAQTTGSRPSCALIGTNAPDTLSTVAICSSAVATSGTLRMRTATPSPPGYSPKRMVSTTACGVPLTIAILASVEPTTAYSTRGCAQKKPAVASSRRLTAA